MADRWCARRLRWVLAAAAVLALGGWQTTLPAAEGPLEKLDISLKFIPDDAAFYSVMLRNREQYEAVANSNAVAKLKDMPVVKMLLLLYQMQAMNPEGPGAKFQQALKDPEVKQLLDLLADMASDEIFFYGDKSFIGFLGLMQEVNAANQFAPLVALARGEGEEANKAQAAMIVKVLADHADQVKVPSAVIGFKTTRRDAVLKNIDKLETLLQAATEEAPELKGRIKRTEVAGNKYLTLSLDGKMIPWDELPTDDLKGAGIDEKSLEKLIDGVKEQTLVIALGMRGDYVLLSIGATTDALAGLGTGGRLIDRAELKPLAKFADKRLTSIGYASADLNRVANSQAKQFDALVVAVGQAVREAGLPEEEQKQIEKDAAELAKDIKGQLPVPGAIVGWSFLTDKGIEGYQYNWIKKTQLDGSKPLGLLEHLDGSPAIAMVARGIHDPSGYDLLVKWVKTGYGYFEKYGLPSMDQDEQEQAKKFIKLVTPLVERADKANRTMLIPALKDSQGGLVVDTELSSKHFIESLPETEKAMPMVEPAIVVGVSDAELLKKACAEYQEVFDALVDVIREIEPDGMPKDYAIPRPKLAKTDAGEVYTYAAPKDWGLDERITLALGLSDTVGVIASSKEHAERLLKSTPPELGGLLQKTGKPMAVAAVFDWAGLLTASQPWIDLAVNTYVTGSDSEKELTRTQVQTVVDVLKVFSKLTAVTYFEDEVLVTHTLLEIRDVESK